MAAKSNKNESSALYTALLQLGLTAQEAGLYVLSLEIGPHPIGQIAEKLGVSRPNIYKLIKSLENIGLAALPKGGRLKRFSVASPTIVNELLDLKQKKDRELKQEFSSLLPDLLSKYQRGDLPSHVRVYQGRGQYIGAFFGMLDEGKDSLDFFGSVDDFLNLIAPEDQAEYLKERVRRGLSSRTLTLSGQHANRIAGEDKENMRETRILNGLNPFKASFHFFADKVIFWQPENLLAIRIEDDVIATMMKSVFEMLWQSAPRATTSNLS
ncbi:MAG: helix-turn-helix domain-containing protein [Patescibacteria group bacterium]